MIGNYLIGKKGRVYFWFILYSIIHVHIDKVVEAKAKAELRLVAVFGLIPPPTHPTPTLT